MGARPRTVAAQQLCNMSYTVTPTTVVVRVDSSPVDVGGCGQTNATVVADLLSSYVPFRDVLLFLSPNHSQACPTVDACTGASAYKTITIVNPLVMSSRPVVTGGTVSCPPTCPGTETTVGPGGMYYTDTCQGGYLNGSVCLQPDTSRYCAFGTGDSCMPCTWLRMA